MIYQIKRGPGEYYVNMNRIDGMREAICGRPLSAALEAMAKAIEQPVWQCQRDYTAFGRLMK